LIFFINGFVVASWVPHIPEVKERLALGEFQLGIALVAIAVGSVLVAGTRPATPAIIAGALTWLMLTARHDLAPPGVSDFRP